MRYCEILDVNDEVTLKKGSYQGLDGMQSWCIKDGSMEKGSAGKLVVFLGLEVISG